MNQAGTFHRTASVSTSNEPKNLTTFVEGQTICGHHACRSVTWRPKLTQSALLNSQKCSARLKSMSTNARRYAGYVVVRRSSTKRQLGFSSSGFDDVSRATARTNPDRKKKYCVQSVPKVKTRTAAFCACGPRATPAVAAFGDENDACP